MCRWFAYISNDEECLLEDVLILPDHAISKQVDDHFIPGLWPWEKSTKGDDETEETILDRNFNNNTDGLGMVWYTTTRSQFTDPGNLSLMPTIYKTLSNPPTDQNFISICSTTSTNTILAHIRAASPAMPVNEANCHPFIFGRQVKP
jgi:glutamine amidotransferase